MVLSEHSVAYRTWQPGKGDFSYLMMMVEPRIRNKFFIAKSMGASVLEYLFARIWEDSARCGESGLHQFITNVELKDVELKIPGFPKPMTPVKAWVLSLSKEEYDEHRLRRKSWVGSRENHHPFPEYAYLEVGTRSDR